MKIFRTKQPDPYEEGYQDLMQDLEKTTKDLKNTYVNLSNVIDPDLIDYYIYHAKAMQIRHKFLLTQLKQLDRREEIDKNRGSHARKPLFLSSM